jgi:hypothetical protein
MHLVLVVPRLVALALAPEPGAVAAPRLPGLARLVAAAGAPVRNDDGLAAALAAHYGVARQTDWPLAPLRLAALGVDPGDAYWLAADPVTLVAGRDDTRVGTAIRDLTEAESAALIAMLNAHFDGDGLLFVAPRPDAWFVRAPAVPALSTRPLDVVQGKSLRTQMPTGDDAKTWWRWQEELQMMLFTHPVTAAREREGRAAANGVWLSTGGMRPPPPAGPADSISTFAGDDTAVALAAHAGAIARALPAHLDAAIEHAGAVQSTVVSFAAPVDFEIVDRAFAAPAAQALARGALETVTVIADGAGSALRWTAQRPGWTARIASRFTQSDLAPLLAAATREET